MEHSLYIDQLTLEFWKGKIDAVDCLLISFIHDLDPKNPTLRKYMYKDHFMITLKRIQDQLPILTMSHQGISKHMIKLKELGILSGIQKTVDGNKKINFYRLSDLFWKVYRTRHEAATKAAQAVKAVLIDEEKPATTVARTVENNAQKACNYSTQSLQLQLHNESTKDSLSSFAPAAVEDGASANNTELLEKESPVVADELQPIPDDIHTTPERYAACTPDVAQSAFQKLKLLCPKPFLRLPPLPKEQQQETMPCSMCNTHMTDTCTACGWSPGTVTHEDIPTLLPPELVYLREDQDNHYSQQVAI